MAENKQAFQYQFKTQTYSNKGDSLLTKLAIKFHQLCQSVEHNAGSSPKDILAQIQKDLGSLQQQVIKQAMVHQVERDDIKNLKRQRDQLPALLEQAEESVRASRENLELAKQYRADAEEVEAEKEALMKHPKRSRTAIECEQQQQAQQSLEADIASTKKAFQDQQSQAARVVSAMSQLQSMAKKYHVPKHTQSRATEGGGGDGVGGRGNSSTGGGGGGNVVGKGPRMGPNYGERRRY